MPREIPYRGLHRQGVRRQPNLPWSPMPKVCSHGLLVCACRPATHLTQPITPEVRHG